MQEIANSSQFKPKMATLQKFKLLATQCAVPESPTRSPTTSPVIHFRRRKTLRMLLSRNGESGRRHSRREDDSPDRRVDAPEQGKEMVVSHKLRDLFVSSPPFEGGGGGGGVEVRDDVGERFVPVTGCAGGGRGGGLGSRPGGTRSLRPLSATFRQRLLRTAWRPVLGGISE